MKTMISVIIPTYNRSISLLKAIKSVLSQKIGEKVEIIVCDDGSTDNTEEVVAQLSKLNPSIRYMRLQHSGGPAVPRNAGTKLANGTWVAFLDSDDIWRPTKLHKQLTYAREHHLNFICTNALRSVGNQKRSYFPTGISRANLTFPEILNGNPVICSSVLVKKTILTNVDGFPEDVRFIAIEDYACWLKIALKNNIGYISDALLEYSDNPESTIRRKWTNSKSQYQILIPYIFSWYFVNFKPTYQYLSALVPLFLARLKYK